MSTLFVLCFYFIPQLHAGFICFTFVMLERDIGLRVQKLLWQNVVYYTGCMNQAFLLHFWRLASKEVE